MEEITVKLMKEEVLFLASLTGSEEFLGIDNFMFTLSEDEIKKEWNKVQNSLEEKQFIEVGFDGSIIIDELIYAIINTCTNANLYLCQKLSNQDNKTREIHYYISEYLTIKMEEDISDKTSVEFNLLFTVEDVYEAIIKDFLLEDLPLCCEESVTLPEETLEEIKGLTNNKDLKGAQEILVKLGFDNKVSVELLELLSRPKIYNSLIMIRFEAGNAGDVSELILLQSNNHLWRCKLNIIDDRTFYQFTNISYTQCLENLYILLKQIESIYTYGMEEIAG